MPPERTADWLALAAAPTFALMAAVTAISEAGAHQMACSMHMSPLSGMALMYGLMGGFHLKPWLRLVSRWRGGISGSFTTAPSAGRGGEVPSC